MVRCAAFSLHSLTNILLILCHVTPNLCSLFDPHVYPKKGPFFEGWYARITDFTTNDSFGFLFGSVLPIGHNMTSNDPLVIGSVLRRQCNTNRNCILTSYNSPFSIDQLHITVNGKPVVHNPDLTSPSNFTWSAKSATSFLLFQQTQSETILQFKSGNVSLNATIGSPVPWGPGGEGPEGWIDMLTFIPLHWFVFSLGSPVIKYSFKDSDRGIFKTGSKAVAHLEKNWGSSFPAAWIWSEAVGSRDGISFALSGGPVSVGPSSVTAFLIGYRNPAKGISLNYRPDNSVVSVSKNGCFGYANITARGLLHDLHISVEAKPSSFSNCLLGPMTTGFRKVCTESYDAISRITVYKRGLISNKIIDEQEINNAALEFGGYFTCNKKCKN